MHLALRVYSSKGLFKEEIKAVDIKSREDARKLGPFASDDRLLVWVSRAYYKDGKLKSQAHFRRYPKASSAETNLIAAEILDRHKSKKQNTKHSKAQNLIASTCKEMINNKQSLVWSFVDSKSSDFKLSGDLLAYVERVETEYKISTPFGEKYRLDVALLGPMTGGKRLVLGGIEIEDTHRFEFSKTLFCKTLGFPLMSIDISNANISNLDRDWAVKSLTETKTNSPDNRRKNYVYIHPMLYSVYLVFPSSINKENRHQFIIFPPEDKFKEVMNWIRRLKDVLKVRDNQVNISVVRNVNKQTEKQIIHAGHIAGESWREFSENKFIQLSIDRPSSTSPALYFFHLKLASLCNSFCPSLVGYKYALGIAYDESQGNTWRATIKDGNEWVNVRIAPVQVSEPVDKIIQAVKRLKK
jgi:uncharacterized protein (DUF736 family)